MLYYGSNSILRTWLSFNFEAVYNLLQKTIDVSYRDIYPIEAIEAFKDYCSKDNILNDAVNGHTLVVDHPRYISYIYLTYQNYIWKI